MRFLCLLLGFPFCGFLLSHSVQSQPAPKGVEALQVPEGYTVEQAAGPDLVAYPMCGTVDPEGRLFVTESSGLNISGKAMAAEPQCRIRCLIDEDGDGVYDKSTIFADKLSLPMGVLWHGGALYAASPPDFYRFEDTDGDAIADKTEILLTGWNILNTASLHGPFLGSDGWLYLTHGRHGYKIETKEGAALEGQAARIWRCRPDGTQLERVCGGGFDNPVEMIFTPLGEMIGTMTYFTDPMNGQRDALDHWVEGGVYSKPGEVLSEFIRTGDLLPPMSKFARIAPAGLIQVRGEGLGADLRGNLLSAQFNPHRVQRHILHREGATYRTSDSDFLTSLDPDLFLTDVIQDGDGSLLVLNTGAWYVDACPLSRVAKPEIKGCVFRVRRSDWKSPEDPFGKEVPWRGLSSGELAKLLGDPRPFVRDRAFEALIQGGAQSVEALSGWLETEATDEFRCPAVWALMQISDHLQEIDPTGSDQALAAIRQALEASKFEGVRVAAAWALGRLNDTGSLPLLEKAVGEQNPALRLAAATSLGRAGDPVASQALLAAASDHNDPFAAHALIYALIRLRNPEALDQGLDHPSPSVRRAALIALDQIGGEVLKADHLKPFFDETFDSEAFAKYLPEDIESARKAALWVVSRHPDWAEVVLESIRGQMASPTWGKVRADSIREALLAFSGQAGAQTLVAAMLADPIVDATRKAFLFKTIAQDSSETLPESWLEGIRTVLDQDDPPVRWEAVNLVRTRELAALDPEIEKIAANPEEPADLRVAALDVLALRKPEPSPEQFDLLLSLLSEETDPTLRLSAATVLGKSRLQEGPLLRLAFGPLVEADALILPSLARAFKGQTQEEVGKAIVGALSKSSAGAQILGVEDIRDLLSTYPSAVAEAATPIYEKLAQAKQERIAKLEELEPLLSGGDVGRGRHVFFGKKTACSTCHTIGEEGGRLGPDLTSIGKIRTGRDILEAIVFPSASLVPGYEPVRVETIEDTFNGILGDQTSGAVVLKTGADAEVRIPQEDISKVSPSTVSLMPQGLDTGVTQSELLDLMAFLQAQNGNDWLLPESEK